MEFGGEILERKRCTDEVEAVTGMMSVAAGGKRKRLFKKDVRLSEREDCS